MLSRVETQCSLPHLAHSRPLFSLSRTRPLGRETDLQQARLVRSFFLILFSLSRAVCQPPTSGLRAAAVRATGRQRETNGAEWSSAGELARTLIWSDKFLDRGGKGIGDGIIGAIQTAGVPLLDRNNPLRPFTVNHFASNIMCPLSYKYSISYRMC